jgi:hypothetical protein
MKLTLVIISTFIFAFSLFVFLSATYEFDWLNPNYGMLFQLAVMLSFASVFWRVRKKDISIELLRSVPNSYIGTFVLLAFILVTFVGYNFVSCAFELKFLSPEYMNGKYVLHSHGKVVQELSSSEYTHYKFIEARMFSGHWLAFSFVPMAFYFILYRAERNLKSLKTAA